MNTNGVLTLEVVEKSMQILGANDLIRDELNEFNQDELNLMDYLYLVKQCGHDMYGQDLSMEDRKILKYWQDRRWLFVYGNFVLIAEKFWEKICYVLRLESFYLPQIAEGKTSLQGREKFV